jgi:undecaprenyl-diphosphatase
MTWWVGALLGVVQGTFMFVPVSSTSHLALTQHALGGLGVDLPDPESAEMILYDLVLHVGTLVSIVVVLRGRLLELGLGLRAEVGRARRGGVGAAVALRSQPRSRVVGLLLITTATTGVLGLGIRAVAPEVFSRPAVIAGFLVVTGGLLWWTDRVTGTVRAVSAVGVGAAVGIGAAQALALLPGLSRSGLTIAAALALGLRRQSAAEYSFIVAIPTILAATVVQGADEIRRVGLDGFAIPPGTWLIGFVVAALVGVVALQLVLRLLYAARFRVFTAYVWLLAGVVLVTGVGA